MQLASYRTAIESYLSQKGFLFVPEDKERIHFLKWVEVAFDKSNNYKGRLLVLTNKGVHLFKPPASTPCSVCAPENLCPDGPRHELKFTYS